MLFVSKKTPIPVPFDKILRGLNVFFGAILINASK